MNESKIRKATMEKRLIELQLFLISIFRTQHDRVSFQNKVVAEFGAGSERSFVEFPFRCTYKKISSLDEMNELQPLYKRGQGK